MNALRNKVQLIGNLGANPEVKTLESGKKVARLRLVTNERYRNQAGELVNEATWHNLVAWGKSAEIAEKYLEKGKEVAIEGKLTNRSYTAKDGTTKYVSEVVISEFLMLGHKTNTQS